MPNNFLVSHIPEAKNKEIIDRGKARARQFARDLLSHKARWRRLPVFSDLIACISKFLWKMEPLKRHTLFTVNDDTCTSCGICVQVCPTRNISLQPNSRQPDSGRQIPHFGLHCQGCMRCFGCCPTQSIRLGSCKPYRSVPTQRFLHKDK